VVRTHVIVGWPDEVRAALDRAHADGRLVGVDEVSRLADRQVQVSAQLREPTAPRFRWLVRWSWPSARVWLRVALVLLGAAAVAGLVWAVVAAVTALVAVVSAAVSAVAAWVSTYWPVLAGIALVLLLCTTGRAARCVGMHCGGCRR